MTCLRSPAASATAVSNPDQDGFANVLEHHLGTDPFKACPATLTPDDEAVDAWPVDLNDDRQITGADLSAVAGVIGLMVPPAPVRMDLDGNYAITGADLFRVAGQIGTACVP